MPFQGIRQPNEFSQGLYSIQAASGRIEFDGQVKRSVWAGLGQIICGKNLAGFRA